MNLAIACDHAGYELKAKLIDYLQDKGYQINDLGSFTNQAVDYPEYGHKLARHLAGKKSEYGISLCGSGNGINMTANKHPLIRSALCWNEEIAELARRHNNANICALPARFISFEQAVRIVDTFLNAPFDGGRHQRRIDHIPI
jgi:ribose 5-phosphate isomerase B